MIVYTLRNCPTCDKARTALNERGVEFEERRVDENADWWDEALNYAFTVPVLSGTTATCRSGGRVSMGERSADAAGRALA